MPGTQNGQVRAFARVRLGNGQGAELGHGDMIGRLWSLALCVDDPRVSEAHAMISLRDQQLKLLALRGRFAVGGRTTAEVALVPGLEIELAKDLTLTIEAVELPASVLAIQGDGLPRQLLSGVCSLITRPRPAIVRSHKGNAEATMWSGGLGWSIRLQGGETRPVMAGVSLTVDGRTFEFVSVDLETVAGGPTVVRGAVDHPLHIVARFDSVHIHRDGSQPVVLSGKSARIISELVAFGGPVTWQVLAGEVWNEDEDPQQLRRKLDTSLSRLRRKLREARVRPDLVRAGGTGHFELVLHSRDVVEDQS